MALFFSWLLASLVVGLMGRHRSFGFWGFFLSAFFLSPPLILLVLLLTYKPPRRRSA